MTDPKAVLAALANVPDLLLPLLDGADREVLQRRPAPGKWSAHEHACHLAAAQTAMLARLERMLAEEHPAIAYYDPPPGDQEGALLALDLGEAMARFARDRAELVARLSALSPEQWLRSAEHPSYRDYTVLVMARQIAFHDLLHAYRIDELLMRKEWPPEGPIAEIAGALARMRTGEVNRIGPLAVPGLSPRLVRVYLPRTYTPEVPHHALFLFDGQNMFDDEPSFSGGWHLHEEVEGLARARRPVPVVVGIDHGGEERIQELSPFHFEGSPGQLDLLLDWLTGALMPSLAAELNLIAPPAGVTVGGSSLGGLASFYAHFQRPEAFGGVLSMSPSFWVAEQEVLRWIVDQPMPEVSRIYLDCGAREGRGALLPMVAAMVGHLASRGYKGDRLMWRPDAKGAHNERSWRRRLPKALRFLYR